MKPIKNAVIFGAGAIGAYLISGLSKTLGEDLIVCAEGERKERLLKNGLLINGEKYTLNVKTPDEIEDPDIVFVCLKYGALKGAVPQIAKICGSETIVMSLMNGVDSEEIIAEGLGDDSRIIYSLIRIASRRSGNDIRFELPSGAKMGILFGEKGSSAVSERMEAISRLFDDAGIVSHTSENIILDIWLKFASNICMNLPQAVLGVGIGANTDSEYVKDLEHKLNEETINVAEAMGIHMRGIDEGSFRQGYVPSPFIRYSTLQDLDAGRHTEIEMFSGALIRLGKKYSVPTPYNEVVYDCIKALEEKNDGKFDYGNVGNR